MATSNASTAPIQIQLTQGYTATVDIEDGDLALLSWNPLRRHTEQQIPYARRRMLVNGRWITVLLHRLIAERVIGRAIAKHEQVDHIDLNPLNNTRSNLRVVTRQQNMWNQGRHANNKSGAKGVYQRKGKNRWRASISLNGTSIYLGQYPTVEEAHAAYCEAAAKYHGEFANFGEANRG